MKLKMARGVIEGLKRENLGTLIGKDVILALFDDWLEMEAALQEKPAESVENATLSNVKEVARNHGWDGNRFLSSWLDENLALKAGMREKPKPVGPGKIIAYEIFTAFEEDEPAVNEALREGWELFGPPFYGDKVAVLQAMVRREPAK